MEAKILKFHKDELSTKGEAIYSKIRERLEPEHKGEIAAIEVDSEEYFLGRTVVEAAQKARQKHPDKFFYFVRIGFPAVYVHR